MAIIKKNPPARPPKSASLPSVGSRQGAGGKYIFVVGGVMSSVGKGIAAASIAKILQSRG